MEAGRAHIVRTRVIVDNRAVEPDPKTNSGRRSISLDARLVSEFRSHRERQIEERLRAGEAWEDSGFVLLLENGTPVQHLGHHQATIEPH